MYVVRMTEAKHTTADGTMWDKDGYRVESPPKFEVHENGFVYHTYDHKECAEDQAKELNILDGLTEAVQDLITSEAEMTGIRASVLQKHVAAVLTDSLY